MANPFWTSARILLNYKRLIAISFCGSLIGAASFGAGLGMILPTLHLLLEKQQKLGDLVQEYLIGPERAPWKNDLGLWLEPRLPADPLAGFVLVMGIIIVLSIVGSTGTYIREMAAITVSLRAGLAWRKRIFRRLIQVPLEVMMTRGVGDQVSRLLVDTGVMSRGYTMLLGRAVGDVLGGIAALVVALSLNWRLALLAMTCLPLVAVLLRKFGKVIRRATRRVLGEQGRMVSALSESIGALRVVKVHNAEGYERRRFSVINRAIYRQEVRARQVRALSSPLLKTVTHIAVAGIAVLAAWMTFNQGVPPKEFMTVIAALVAAAASIRPLSSLNNQLHESSAAARRVFDLMSLPIEERDETEEARPGLPPHAERIEFQGISYTYPNASEPALVDIDLTVRHGQTIALVGPNGSGKTTLLTLLPRLVAPSTGRILIDGVDIATVRRRSLRQQLGIVTQETILFQGTIADNIAYGRRYESREKIHAAACAAYADEFIAALPDGYDTMLGDGGSGLSGGQRQRLCIARALLRDPTIMILDEATSQIDAESEQKISQALRDQHEKRTTFVIAHRLSTVVDADLIVVMDGGRIIDRGRHEELIERCELYAVLSQTQLKASRPEPAARAAPARPVVLDAPATGGA